jgi:TRAP-type mannitol/chloroaromatic compound transport system substrate-binding protein
MLVNVDSWGELSDAQRAAVETSCAAGVTRNLAKGEAIQGEAIRAFQEDGVATLSLPEPILRELQRVSEEILARQEGEDETFARVLASQRKFSAEYAEWKRLGFLPRDF